MYIQLMRSPLISFFFFYSYVDHLDLHSFPTRRSSDLNYARLYPQPAGGSCDVNAVVRETISRVSDTGQAELRDRKSTRLNSSHRCISYAVFCLKKKKKSRQRTSHSHSQKPCATRPSTI